MISPEQIQQILIEKMPGAQVEVSDLTGTMDHFEARVVWTEFKGKSLVEQHQLVNRALAAPLEDGRIHALKMRTIIPE